MIQCRRGASLLLKATETIRIRAKPGRQHFDRHVPPKAWIACPIHLSHAAFTNRREDFVGAELIANGEPHVLGSSLV